MNRGRQSWRRPAATSVALVLAAASAAPPAAAAQVGGHATIYMGGYDGAIHIIAESTLAVQAKMPLSVGLPAGLTLSHDRKRLYVRNAMLEKIEVFDLETRRSVDAFTMTHGNTKVRIWGFDVDPTQRFAVILIKRYTKLADRFEVGPPRLVRYDLATHTVTDTIPWPKNEDREGARILFSPDGRLLYFFSDDILIYRTDSLREVDRWQLSQPLEEGMGRFSFGFPVSLYEEPGFYTGLFRVTDPVQNRRLMGIARVNLTAKDVDFTVLGPDEGVGFSLAPDRKKAYGLRQRVGDYQFWTFDVENRRVMSRVGFPGRPRMQVMPSSNGRLLYVFGAGNTVDVFDAASYQYLRTATFDVDMIGFLLVPPAPVPGAR